MSRVQRTTCRQLGGHHSLISQIFQQKTRHAVDIETISFRALINANPVVATRDCQLFPIIYFSCFALRKVSVISTFVYRPWSSFLLVIFHMHILSVISASASRYLTVIVNFRKFTRFIVFSPVQYKVSFSGPRKSVAQLYPEVPYSYCKYSFSCIFCSFSKSFVVL